MCWPAALLGADPRVCIVTAVTCSPEPGVGHSVCVIAYVGNLALVQVWVFVEGQASVAIILQQTTTASTQAPSSSCRQDSTARDMAMQEKCDYKRPPCITVLLQGLTSCYPQLSTVHCGHCTWQVRVYCVT